MDDIFGATIQAIRVLSPNLQFTISALEEDRSQVDWDSFKISEANTSIVPSIEEIEAKRTELLAAAPLRTLREERNKRLLETDWIVARAYETNQSIPQEWIDYRQALRDITESYSSLQNVVWPEKP